jgi:hypothetical protein
MEFETEDQKESNWDLGSFNVDYVLIANASGDEVYRDEDFDDQVKIEQHRKD